MSEAVLGYQIMIFASVIGIGVLVGPQTLLGVAVCWALWTIVMVFSSWLFVLQFASIFIAFAIAVSIQQKENFANIQRVVRKGAMLLVGAGAMITGASLFNYIKDQREFEANAAREVNFPSAPTPLIASKAAPVTGNGTQDSAELAYQQALHSIEQRHPELNPDLPGFRQDVVNEVLRRMEQYEQRGLSRIQSLQTAVQDMERIASPAPVYVSPQVIASQQPSRSINERAAPAKEVVDRTCHYKSVMSDQDYINCGVRPPGTF